MFKTFSQKLAASTMDSEMLKEFLHIKLLFSGKVCASSEATSEKLLRRELVKFWSMEQVLSSFS